MTNSGLSPAVRIRQIQEIAGALLLEKPLDIDLYFSEFGVLNKINDWGSLESGIRESLQNSSDEILFSLREFLLSAVTVPTDSHHTWNGTGIRLFMSHSTGYKTFVSEVSSKLEIYGIQSFVAHSDIQSGATWFEVMTNAIRTCDVFVAFIHEDFKSREWCDHELGFALGLELQPLLLNFGHQPYGFLKQLQYKGVEGFNEDRIAGIIFEWLKGTHAYSGRLEDTLVARFVGSTTFDITRDVYRKISLLQSIQESNYLKIVEAFRVNDQVYKYGGFRYENGECTWLAILKGKIKTT